MYIYGAPKSTFRFIKIYFKLHLFYQTKSFQIKLSSRKQPKSVKGTSVEKKIPRERQRKLFATNNEQNDTFAKSLEVSRLSNQKEESNSSSEILTPDKSYLSMLKKLSLDMV